MINRRSIGKGCMRKILVIVIATLLLFSVSFVIPDYAYSSSTVAYGTCGYRLNWKLDDEGLLTIYGTGEMNSFSNGQAPWYPYRDSIKTVFVEEGATSIGTYAFYQCDNITSVTISEGLTSIEQHAFYGCDNLTNIIIPDGVTAIGKYAFSYCYSLASIIIPDGITSLSDNLFCGCTSLSNVAIPNSVTSLGVQSFMDCSGLVDIALPDSVISIGEASFFGCSSLESIMLPEGITCIEPHTFYDCNRLKNIIMPESLTYIEQYAFYNCDSLESVIIPEGVFSIGEYVFNNCDNLISVAIPGSVTSIGNDLFSYKDPLTIVYTIPDAYVALDPPDNCMIMYLCDAVTGQTDYPYDIIPLENPVMIKNGSSKYLRFYTYPYGTAETISFTSKAPEIADIDENGRITANSVGITTATISSGSVQKNVKVRVTEKYPIPAEPIITRLFGGDRFTTAIAAADHLKEKNGISTFDNIIVASGIDFPDALSASYLAYVKNAPILLVSNNTISMVTYYINTNLAPNGTVFIVGGKGAVTTEVEDNINGTVKRLAGSNRFDTNLEVLKEAGFIFDETENVLVACGTNFADALSASAVGEPILLVGKELTQKQINYFSSFMPAEDEVTLSAFNFSIIGGTGAVPENVEKQLNQFGSVGRISGGNRYTTSMAVAEHFFPLGVDTVVIANGNIFPDGLSGGPVATAYDAPLILVIDSVNNHAKAYFSDNEAFRLIVMGGKGVISDDTVDAITDDGYNITIS